MVPHFLSQFQRRESRVVAEHYNNTHRNTQSSNEGRAQEQQVLQTVVKHDFLVLTDVAAFWNKRDTRGGSEFGVCTCHKVPARRRLVLKMQFLVN